jgi:uncharacterized membrane protein
VVTLGATIFGLVFTSLSIARFQTFNSSFNDLGFWNQAFWITLHGGPGAWASGPTESNFFAVYPWSSSSFLVLEPIYAIYESPASLLLMQGVAVPLAAIPLYLYARSVKLPGSWAAVTSASYLLNFQIQGAALNDFHMQSFFPLFFFSSLYFLQTRRRRSFAVTAILAGLINPLTLGVVVALALMDSVKSALERGSIRSRLARFSRSLRLEPERAAVAVALVSALALQWLVGSIGVYHVGTAVGGTYVSTIPTRELFFIMTLAPFLGLTLLTVDGVILSSPLLVFLVIGSTQYFGYFGHQDSMEYVATFTAGFTMWLASRHSEATPRPTVVKLSHGAAQSSRVVRQQRRIASRWSLEPSTQARWGVVGAFGIGLILSLSYSPISPFNNHQGLLQDVNERYQEITQGNSAVDFLNRVIGLIPADASVLTQNNIPQLSGRSDVAWAFPGIDSVGNVSRFQFILGANSVNAFSEFWFAYLDPYIGVAYSSGEFGTVAFGDGVILLERGYVGPPQLFARLWIPATQFELSAGQFTDGVATYSGSPAGDFWYGPYTILPPGHYSATFVLNVSATMPKTDPIIILAVSEYDPVNGTTTFYNSTLIDLGNFSSSNTWENFTLLFTAPTFLSRLEFPGYEPTGAAALRFMGVLVTPQGSLS